MFSHYSFASVLLQIIDKETKVTEEASPNHRPEVLTGPANIQAR